MARFPEKPNGAKIEDTYRMRLSENLAPQIRMRLGKGMHREGR